MRLEPSGPAAELARDEMEADARAFAVAQEEPFVDGDDPFRSVKFEISDGEHV
jgi:hypothetical protein